MATTARGIHYPASGDTPDVPRDLGNTAADLDAMWTSGTSGTRPAAGIVGRERYETDTGQVMLDIGTSWVRKGGTDTLKSGDLGSTVQAYDAELAALAALVSAADKLPYFTGAGAAALADLTAAARTLLDDTSVAAMRTTLGLGGAALLADPVPLGNGGTGAASASAARTNIGTPTYSPEATVTSLPGSPVDGQEIYYLADATNGNVLHLKYRSGSSSAYKWEVVGPTDFTSEVDTGESRTNNAYGDLATVGPSITIPALAGDYIIEFGAGMNTNVAAQTAFCSINIGGAVGDADALAETGSTADVNSVARMRLKTAIAASTTIKHQYRGNGGSTVYAERRWLKIRPRRVG